MALTVYTCMQIRVRPTHNLAQHGVCVICAKLLLMLVCVCVCVRGLASDFIMNCHVHRICEHYWQLPVQESS